MRRLSIFIAISELNIILYVSYIIRDRFPNASFMWSPTRDQQLTHIWPNQFPNIINQSSNMELIRTYINEIDLDIAYEHT